MTEQSTSTKVALVTGASSGIGKATALAFGKQGIKVALLSRSVDAIEKVKALIEAEGGDAICLPTDVSSEKEIADAVKAIIDAWGRLDIVFANAGINGVWAPIDQIMEEEWNKTVSTNLTGVFLTVKHTVPVMKTKGGAIIITSSINGTRVFSNTGATAYSCTKAAQSAFSKMIALELAPFKIRVNVVCPGAIVTEINEKTTKRNLDSIAPDVVFPDGEIPLTHGKPGTAKEVADLVLFLASDAAAHITGAEVFIDGGQSLLRG